jgi:hypothetical protein
MKVKVPIVFLALMLSSCVSHRHEPELENLIQLDSCESFSGTYKQESSSPGNDVRKYIFDTDQEISLIEIEIKDLSVSISGRIDSQKIVKRNFSTRGSTCTDSVLKLVVEDDYTANGVAANYTGRKLQLFSVSDQTVSLRLVSSNFMLFYIVPFYYSADSILTLTRVH